VPGARTEPLLGALAAELTPFGLNLIGVAAAREYDALVPEAYRLGSSAPGSAIVFGSGGGAFWRAYRAHLDRHPELATSPDPLDEFTAAIMEQRALPLARRHGLAAELRLPFRSTVPPLSFVHLAEAAGLGCRSILGVLVHPEFGPWMALRGALLVDAELTAPRPAAGFDPCPGCVERPCIGACPGRAIRFPAGWDVPRCIDHRVTNPMECMDRCHARVECIYGRRHRYPDDALAYHQRRAFAAMAAARCRDSLR